MTNRTQPVTHHHVPPIDRTARGDDLTTRPIIVIEPTLANPVEVTLKHGRYDTRIVTFGAIAQTLQSWHPELALVDIDHNKDGIAQCGGGLSSGGIPILAF